MKLYLTDKEMNHLVAHMIAHHHELYAEAFRVAATVEALAAKHNKTGHYVGSLRVEEGNPVDVDVVATDKAAAHIEWGHKLSGVVPDDAVPGVGPVEFVGDVAWVPGLHIMRNAAIAHGGKVG